MGEYSGYTFKKLKLDKGVMGRQPLTEKNVDKKDSEEFYELMEPAYYAKLKVESWITSQTNWVAKNGKCANPDEFKNETLVWKDEKEPIPISSDESSEEEGVNPT